MTTAESKQPADLPDYEQETLNGERKELLLLPLTTDTGQETLQRIISQNVVAFQKHFQARDSDMVVVTQPKSGTTWLKALAFATVYRHRLAIDQTHPLLTSNSHVLVPSFEANLYENNRVPDLSKFPEPRLFGSHLPFPSLGTLKDSNGKIVYMCRNPFDTFVSYWTFINTLQSPPTMSLDEALNVYCKGIGPFGPFWDHMLGYWAESFKRPNNVLFLNYEDMKKDGAFHLKRMAKFLDCPFSEEEERISVVEDILKLCSFETMKELDINKTGKFFMEIGNKSLFRKGKVGDYVNYLNPTMVEKLSEVIQERLGGSGLSFQVFQ